MSRPANQILTNHFKAFYQEVLNLQQEARAGTLRIPPPHQDSHHNVLAENLTLLLKRQTEEMEQIGSQLMRQLATEARYLMVGLADEVFLSIEWDGQDYWRNHLMEVELFSSQSAGEKVFEQLNVLLLKNDPAYTDLGQVYMMALALGFQGQYRGMDPNQRLPGYLKQLYAFIFKRQPHFNDDELKLFPSTYDTTLGKGEPGILPSPRGRLVTLGLVIAGLLALSEFLWWDLTSELNQIIRTIQSISN